MSRRTMSGPFGLCSEIWDSGSNRYVSATDSQIIDCCMNTNIPLIDKCAKKCHKLDTKKF